MVGWVADEQSSTDFAGLAPGLDEDSEERGVGEGHAREVQHDRLTWGEVRLDCALKVVEVRHVNLAPQGDDSHEADFDFQLAGHAPKPSRQIGSLWQGAAQLSGRSRSHHTHFFSRTMCTPHRSQS